tara:strand:+ start:132 stop:509 length:378 start_codon:yes stop_codon:yes gene_type:complete
MSNLGRKILNSISDEDREKFIKMWDEHVLNTPLQIVPKEKMYSREEWDVLQDSLIGQPLIDESIEDTIVRSVREDLKRRSELGIKKYGVTLDRTDLKLKDWLQHLYEETLDSALYLKRAIKELNK